MWSFNLITFAPYRTGLDLMLYGGAVCRTAACFRRCLKLYEQISWKDFKLPDSLPCMTCFVLAKHAYLKGQRLTARLSARFFWWELLETRRGMKHDLRLLNLLMYIGMRQQLGWCLSYTLVCCLCVFCFCQNVGRRGVVAQLGWDGRGHLYPGGNLHFFQTGRKWWTYLITNIIRQLVLAACWLWQFRCVSVVLLKSCKQHLQQPSKYGKCYIKADACPWWWIVGGFLWGSGDWRWWSHHLCRG